MKLFLWLILERNCAFRQFINLSENEIALNYFFFNNYHFGFAFCGGTRWCAILKRKWHMQNSFKKEDKTRGDALWVPHVTTQLKVSILMVSTEVQSQPQHISQMVCSTPLFLYWSLFQCKCLGRCQLQNRQKYLPKFT